VAAHRRRRDVRRVSRLVCDGVLHAVPATAGNPVRHDCALGVDRMRGKIDDTKWRALADFVLRRIVVAGGAVGRGVRHPGTRLPVDASGHIHLSIGDVLNAYTLLGGLANGRVFLLYGAVFIALKTSGSIRDDAHRIAVWLSLPVTGLVAVFGLWTQLGHGKSWTWRCWRSR